MTKPPMRDGIEPKILISKQEWMVVAKPAGYHTLSAKASSEPVKDPHGLFHDDEISGVYDISPKGPLVMDDSDDISEGQSLEAWLLEQYPEQKSIPDSGIAHRLDQRTSGCLLVARTESSYMHLRDDIRSGAIRKIYLTYVKGLCRSGDFTLYFSSRYKRSQKVTVAETGPEKVRGRCQWTMLKTDRDRSLLEVELLGRGKRHQIRAGFAHLGHPLVGDRLYGGPAWNSRFGLHAWKLLWKKHEVICPPPDDWPEDFKKIGEEGEA